jgi:hypothetical protein
MTLFCAFACFGAKSQCVAGGHASAGRRHDDPRDFRRRGHGSLRLLKREEG